MILITKSILLAIQIFCLIMEITFFIRDDSDKVRLFMIPTVLLMFPILILGLL